MTEFNMVFYTDWYTDGYQLGINITIDKKLNDKEYSNLHEKLAFIFKTINYGMDITKITETIKTVLLNNGIKEEDTTQLQISLVGKKDELQGTNFTVVNSGNLSYDIRNYELDNNQEVYDITYNNGKLVFYIHKNITNMFIYNSLNGFEMHYDKLHDSDRKRNAELNKFFKTNLETLKKLENVHAEELFQEINVNDSILITAYKLFYNEMPDFKDPNIVTKIQCMVAMVGTTVMAMIPFISEHNYRDPNIIAPESAYIRDQIFKLNLLLGNNFSEVEQYNFKAFMVEKIKFTGETIRKYMLQIPEEERMPFLNQFTINYLHTFSNYYHKPLEEMDPKSQEIIRILKQKRC